MPRTTRPFINRIALVFDFDLALAPGTIDAVLARFGIDHDTWRKEELAPLVEDGWDEIQERTASAAAVPSPWRRDHARLPEGCGAEPAALPGTGRGARAPVRPRARSLRRSGGRALHPLVGLHRHHHGDPAGAAVPRHLGLRLRLRARRSPTATTSRKVVDFREAAFGPTVSAHRRAGDPRA